MQSGNVEDREAPQGPEVARVRVSVRSSVYLIVAEVEKDGSMLLDQVCTGGEVPDIGSTAGSWMYWSVEKLAKRNESI